VILWITGIESNFLGFLEFKLIVDTLEWKSGEEGGAVFHFKQMLVAITLVSLFSPSAAHSMPLRKCVGEFSTRLQSSAKVDANCSNGTLRVNNKFAVAIPDQGGSLDISWLSDDAQANTPTEIRISHLSTEVLVSVRGERKSIVNRVAISGSYVINQVDRGCSSDSHSVLNPFNPNGFDWYYNAIGEPSGHSNAIYRIGGAFKTWKNETNRCGVSERSNALAVNYLGLTNNPEAMGGNPPPYTPNCLSTRIVDGYNVVGWGLLPTGVIAMSCVSHTSAGVWDSDIRFSTSYNWFTEATSSGCSNAYDLGDIATHEVGHILGMGHSEAGTDQVMNANAFGCNFWNRKLAKGDLLGFQNIWG